MILRLGQVSESSGRLITDPTFRISGSVGEREKDLRIYVFQKFLSGAEMAGLVYF